MEEHTFVTVNGLRVKIKMSYIIFTPLPLLYPSFIVNFRELTPVDLFSTKLLIPHLE